MKIEEAIRSILDGEAILFAGSGFSHDAKRQDNPSESLCTAQALSHKLLAECGFAVEDYVDDLGQASEIYKSEKGSMALLNFMRREFTAGELTNEQRFLSILPWYRIYTTNYDNVIEKANLEKGRKLNMVVLSDRQSDIQDKRTMCICLNGSLSRLKDDSLLEELKLTNSSYLTDSFRSNPWVSFFQTDLKTAKAVFFIGYSMKYDLDIQRIVFENEELREKTFFILRETERKADIMLIKKFGEPLTIGMTGLVEQIKDVQKTYQLAKKISKPLLCFDRIEVGKKQPIIKDKEVFNMFIKGDVDPEKVYYSLSSPKNIQYCVCRTKLKQMMDSIKNGSRNIILHSSLGNGKTVFLISLGTLLSKNGYKVYFFRSYRSTLNREIEQICEETEPTVVIFDKYSDCIPYLETFKSFRKDQILITADRSSMNDIYYDEMVSLFGDFVTVDLNVLDDGEITQISELFRRYGLWRDKSGFRDDQKKNYLIHDCRRNMAKIILQLLRSQNIISRYKNLIDEIRNKKGYYDAMIYILISQVAEFDVDTDDLVNIFDASQLNSPSFRNNTSVKEFVDFNGNRIKDTSSLFAQVLLEEIFDSGVIVDVMISIFKRLNGHSSRYEVQRVLQKMMTFSNLQHILNKNDKKYKENLCYYYDSIHTLSSCAENPHFWLQYAILKLSEYDYETAQVYFDNAYAYAKKKNRDTFHIDNHYARFILENEVENGSQATCMNAFERAHNILMNPRDNYYYPFRVAIKYFPFYEKFYVNMNNNEKRAFLSACEEMLKKIEKYLNSAQTIEGRGDVIKAKELINKILLT